ncbi:hypothetical protein COU49_00930 [Candidatus Nomurabacteria bacterium CG10_big_fil_rev_8_21_14_0_10_35_16]|uniref:Uncharacterized protein n=1 Tax=Candidatus Nomurabacteria bacterium CG10_big_fil_rev_8_21_14_0_10_35_16 TaxID=1974731 RepID=A0A2H0TDQ6_9BACT|nr:MAG: hypothetical protein COU49_00930 [Candidatus Nomurabacteria bacterium CG10_big_fil_rev_8_21_14_0_10_35_16]
MKKDHLIIILISTLVLLLVAGYFSLKLILDENQSKIEDLEQEVVKKTLEEPKKIVETVKTPPVVVKPEPVVEEPVEEELVVVEAVIDVNGKWTGKFKEVNPVGCASTGEWELQLTESDGLVSGFYKDVDTGRLPLTGSFDGENLKVGITSSGQLVIEATGLVSVDKVLGNFISHEPCGGSDKTTGLFEGAKVN